MYMYTNQVPDGTLHSLTSLAFWSGQSVVTLTTLTSLSLVVLLRLSLSPIHSALTQAITCENVATCSTRTTKATLLNTTFRHDPAHAIFYWRWYQLNSLWLITFVFLSIQLRLSHLNACSQYNVDSYYRNNTGCVEQCKWLSRHGYKSLASAPIHQRYKAKA